MKHFGAAAAKILRAALAEVASHQAVCRCLTLTKNILRFKTASEWRVIHLQRFKRLVVLGAGKAAWPMAAACEELFGDRLDEGVIITKYGQAGKLNKITCLEAGHPLPDRAGLSASRRLLSLLQEAGEDTLIVFLTSGGCSALYTVPHPSVTLAHKRKTTDLLLRSGATIQELNAVRKHLSMVKGGWSAYWSAPATVVNLVLSDVVGDALEVIGSGPFSPDPTSFGQAWGIIEKYGLARKVPPSITAFLKKGGKGRLPETPKIGDPCFSKVTHSLIATNRLALKAAEKEARRLGYQTYLLTSQIQGEAKTLARFYGAAVREIVEWSKRPSKPLCLLAGGEPTVTVTGTGLGGRNTELALAVAREIQGLENVFFVSIGTDGTDGPTDAAGAWVDGRTWLTAVKKGLDPERFLAENDAYTFFQKTGGLIKTGPTGTNVMDLHICLTS